MPTPDMLKRTMALLQRNDWRVAQVRLTAFPGIPVSTPDPSWWSEVTGQEPDDTTVSTKKLTATAFGPFANGKLSLEVRPERIDWRMDPEDVELDTLITEPRIPDIAAFDDAVRPFSELCR